MDKDRRLSIRKRFTNNSGMGQKSQWEGIVETSSSLDSGSEDNEDYSDSNHGEINRPLIGGYLNHNLEDSGEDYSAIDRIKGVRSKQSSKNSNVSLLSNQNSGDNKVSNAMLVSRKGRSNRRTTTDLDNDFYGYNEVDNNNNFGSDNDLNTSGDQDKKRAINDYLNRWRQGTTVFVRSRMQSNKQQGTSGGRKDIDNRRGCEIIYALDDGNGSVERISSTNNHNQPKKLNQESSQLNTVQCSELGSMLGRSILFLKYHFSASSNPSNQQVIWLQEIDVNNQSNKDRQSKELPSWNMPISNSSNSNTNKYQSPNAFGEFRSFRKSSTRSMLRESQRLGGSNGYSKLNHHYHHCRTSSQKSIIHELKRLLLLLLIIAVSCILLWKLYQVLTDEYNYLGVVETSSKLGKFKYYAVSTDAKPCAKVGSALLAKGGSAVDAAIGTLLCMGVVIPNSMGLGGGCLMTIYDSKTKEATVIDGREIAPDYATENMFANDSLKSSRGPFSIGVPGELAAYWEAHRLFGKLAWSELFNETIHMAENGVPSVEHLAFALRAKNHAQYISEPLSEIYTNKATGQYLDEGDILVQKELANTLKRIRDGGVSEFYGGLTGQRFIEDLKKQGGNMTLENLINYKVLVKKPLKFNLENNLILYTQPPPGSGIVLGVILRIMKELGYYKGSKPHVSLESSGLYYHRLTEAFKFAYAQRAGLEDKPDDPVRMKKLVAKLLSNSFIEEAASKIDNQTHNDDRYGGIEYFSEDHGTAHVSVLDAEGNAAAVTSSVNLYFGSGLVSPSTGIIYNDVMDDFVSPNLVNKFNLAPSKYNHIRPGKRPISSMAPSVFTDANGNVKLVIGGSGGAKITSAIASVSLRNCFLEENIKTAIDGPRIHHQFLPNKIWHEINFPKDLLHSLTERGHILQPILDRSSVIMAIASDQVNSTLRDITANSDYRKGGSVSGL